MTTPHQERSGYSLIEVMLAVCLLVMGLAAAASLAHTMSSQEEKNLVVTRVLNWQEQACRLYQLGLQPATISAILPTETTTVLAFSTTTTMVTGVGYMDLANCQVTFSLGTSPNSTDEADRSNVITVGRPSIRGN